MTWLPIFNAFSVFLFLVSAILWNMAGLALFLVLASTSSLFLWLETATNVKLHYLDSFWYFILSEVIAFSSLLVGCLWFEEDNMEHLSHHLEIPLFGSFLLIGSSLTITAYHHTMGYSSDVFHLFATILLGIAFVLLQFIEFSYCGVDLITSVYHACCFCTVGLHFTHVLIGLLLLIVLFCVGETVFGYYYATLMVWYWHFVDYIWLLVYTVVYLC
uniref:Cytochrome c oxidase subunit 3 n=1 Tax=Euryhaliotrema johni TaxID=2849187 RepID=A0A8F2TCA7_9PLAT|nr:cytochrome c oxidase subunit 3 [Euryhaliotrema johni]